MNQVKSQKYLILRANRRGECSNEPILIKFDRNVDIDDINNQVKCETNPPNIHGDVGIIGENRKKKIFCPSKNK